MFPKQAFQSRQNELFFKNSLSGNLMIKMKFDDLLVGFVVSIVIFFNTISTTMLNKGFLHVGASSLLVVVALLLLRFF